MLKEVKKTSAERVTCVLLEVDLMSDWQEVLGLLVGEW
jgi:hypothetical protein